MAESVETTKPQQNTLPAPAASHVVGIGASAGGVSALRTLLSHIPASPGMAFVVVVHLSPEHESALAALLQSHSRLPVLQVTETVPIQPNHVYVIPPNANLSAIDTHSRLSPLEPYRVDRAQIDHFLRTLADTHDGNSVGVILTGAGSDDTLGLRKIKERGGLTIAQDPDEAEFDGMPRSAIAAGSVDLVVPLSDMWTQIERFSATHPHLPAPRAGDEIDPEHDASVARVLDELRHRDMHHLSGYKRSVLLRWIRRRMQLNHVVELDDYVDLLKIEPQEADALANDLLFNVAEFFRDDSVFSALEKHIFAELFALKESREDRLRVWSVGCSTGEEAYSLAMLMLEQSDRHNVQPKLQLFASDLSDTALQRARHGIYPEEIATSVSAERLARFFVRKDSHFAIAHRVRDVVLFATHNLFTDPPYAHLDLIVCRNLLRDLRPEMRTAVLDIFHYALEPHGVLIIGGEDNIDDSKLFRAEPSNDRILRRRSGPQRPIAGWPATLVPSPVPGRGSPSPRAAPDVVTLHRAAAVQYEPPSVLIGPDNRVLSYSTRASRYFRLPGGEPRHDVLRLVGAALSYPLCAAIDRVRREGRAWASNPILIEGESGLRPVVLHVDPVAADELPGLLLVTIEELRRGKRRFEAAPESDRSPLAIIAQLEMELEAADRLIHSIRSESHANLSGENDRMRASNAELRALVEELEDAKEELESSKEELQVVNEELITLDRENHLRLEELARLSTDVQHLLESTGIATLFVDRDLNIVRFTPPLAELFSIRQVDVNRPLADLTHRLHYDELLADARQVLELHEPVERELAATSGRWYLTRMLPYRLTPKQFDGVVITFIDITERKRAEEVLSETDRRKDDFLALLAHELRNPLAPITSGIEVLKAHGHDGAIVDEVISTLERQAHQLVRLVDDLLEVSRISGGRLQLRRSHVPVNAVIESAIEAVKPLIDRAGHELELQISDEQLVLDADAARLTQVLINLLNNAARFTPVGGHILLRAERDGDEALIMVEDNGVGIPEEMLGRVFEMFYQGNRPAIDAGAGLGIGLALAKSLIEMHGGRIEVGSSGPNSGSRFTIRLPLFEQTTPVAKNRAAARDRTLGGHRVLIVDDNVDAATTLSLLLRSLGANETHIASSGREALDAGYTIHPDIVLLDLKMPEMDGYECAREIRRAPWGRRVLLVALTGWSQDEHKRRTAEAGFDWHLTKPADRAALEAVLAAAPAKGTGRADGADRG